MKLSDVKLPNIKLSVNQMLGILLTIIVPFIIQNCNNSYKIEQAELHAKTAIELNELQNKQIEKMQSQTKDILDIVTDMAEDRKITREQINALNHDHQVKSDSSAREIIKAKRNLNELWNDLFKKSQN